jgi:hypothetical protein
MDFHEILRSFTSFVHKAVSTASISITTGTAGSCGSNAPVPMIHPALGPDFLGCILDKVIYLLRNILTGLKLSDDTRLTKHVLHAEIHSRSYKHGLQAQITTAWSNCKLRALQGYKYTVSSKHVTDTKGQQCKLLVNDTDSLSQHEGILFSNSHELS